MIRNVDISGFLLLLGTVMLINGLRFPLVFVLAVVIHELGHIITAAILKVRLNGAFSLGAGAVLEYNFSNVSYLTETVVYLAGAAANLLSVAIYIFFSHLGLIHGESVGFFITASIMIAIANLLPAGSLDGGGILKCLLEKYTDKPYEIFRITSLVTSIILWALTVYIQLRIYPNLSLMLFCIYLVIKSTCL